MASGGKRTGSGRKKTPTTLRLLRGNPGRRPINPLEPEPDKGVPEAPRWFSELELSGWETMVAALQPMGVLTVSDGPALTQLAHAWAEWRQAEATVHVEGAYFETPDGSLRKHPAVGVAANAWRRVASMLAEFGLTPSSRARIVVATDPAQLTQTFDAFKARRQRS